MEQGTLKKFWWVGVIAMLAGVLHIAPYIYFERSLGLEYKDVHMTGAYDEDFYLALVNQARVGKSAFANPYTYENRDQGINFRYQILETLIGKIAHGLRLSMDAVALAVKFFSSAILFIILFVFGRSLTKSATGGVLAAVFVEFGNELARLELGPALSTIFHWQSSFNSFLFYDRPVYPSITAIFFFLALFMSWRLLENNKHLLALWLGVFIGLISYLYFYYWAFLIILISALLVIALIRKDYSLAKNYMLTIGIAVLASGPFLLNIYGTLGQAGADTANIAKNFIFTHRFIIEKVLLLPMAILGAIFVWFKHKSRTFPRQFIFLGAVLITGLLASNQQVITGMEVQQHHFHFMTNIPILLLFSGVFLWYLLNLLNRDIPMYRYVKVMTISFVIVAVIAHAVGVQASSYRYWDDEFVDRQRWAGAFSWLNEHTDKNDVVLANFEVSESVPVYTHNYVYGALHAMSYPVPIERLAHNYFTEIYLAGVRADNAREFMDVNRDKMGQYIFEGQYWRATCGSFGCFPDSWFEKLVSDYQTFVSKPFEEQLKKYRLDYVIWDTRRDPVWQLDKYKLPKQVFLQDDVVIYNLKP